MSANHPIELGLRQLKVEARFSGLGFCPCGSLCALLVILWAAVPCGSLCAILLSPIILSPVVFGSLF
eukprot:1813816-Heterocapsa_arctica.AAC.1